MPVEQIADTTVVILNWSRLENVIIIADQHCTSPLEDFVASIFIWNNNPNVSLTLEVSNCTVCTSTLTNIANLYFQNFKETGCDRDRLRIYNSPENVYFQARYLACKEAVTEFCFVQVSHNSVWLLKLFL